MNRHLINAAALCLAFLLPLAASAQSQGNVSSLPWNGVAVDLSAANKRANVALYRTLTGPFHLRVEASAPLDEKTQLAQFFDDNAFASGLQTTLAVEYSSAPSNLNPDGLGGGHIQTAREQIAACKSVGLETPCSQQELCEKVGLDAAACTPGELNRKLAFTRHVGFPIYSGITWGVGLELRAGYNRLEAYGSDLAENPTKYDAFNVSSAGYGRLYLGQRTALTLTLGVGRKRTLKSHSVERCKAETSSDPLVTARACKTVNVLDRRSHETAGDLRLTLTQLVGTAVGGFQPGFDVWLNITNLQTSTQQVEGRILAFLAPEKNTLGLRTGLGLAVGWPFPKEGQKAATEITPFAVIGATFDAGGGR